MRLFLKKKTTIFLLLCLFPLSTLAWDSSGHRLIATIAYNNLTSHAKQTIDAFTAMSDPGYPPRARFLYAATQPDKWRETNRNQSPWHFINTPWSTDTTPTQPATTPNLLTILAQNQVLLANTTASPSQRAIALAFVLHLAADAHQPLHTINRFSQAFPYGDKGGNLFVISSPYAANLHEYWDEGVRLLAKPKAHYPLSNRQILALARDLQQQYPPDSNAKDLDANHWVAQSFELAMHEVYQLTPGSSPSAAYVRRARSIVGRQITLAGYRLAGLLNGLLDR